MISDTDKFDLILTNPPFGSVVKRGMGYLEQFDLWKYIGKSTTGIKIEILYLERIHSLLKSGIGRTAIVLPDGILSNSSLQSVRNWLLSHFQLLAVVSLPPCTFTNYGTGVKTSIVFLRRLKDNETVPANALIFMAIVKNIGYDARGRKTFHVTVEQSGEEKTDGQPRIERQRCDLFDFRVFYKWSTANLKKPQWSESHREIIPNTGLVAHWRAFEKHPPHFTT
jgi:type I restriction enzyme M protein